MSGQLWIHEWLTLRHWCLIYELFISLHTPQHKQLYLVICWSYQSFLMLVLLPQIMLVLWNLNRIYNQIWILCTWFILEGSLTLQQPKGFACAFQRIFCWQVRQGSKSAAWEPLVRGSSVLTQHGWMFLAQDKRREWVLGQSSSTSSMPPAHAWDQLQCSGEVRPRSVHMSACRVFPQSLSCPGLLLGTLLYGQWPSLLLSKSFISL